MPSPAQPLSTVSEPVGRRKRCALGADLERDPSEPAVGTLTQALPNLPKTEEFPGSAVLIQPSGQKSPLLLGCPNWATKWGWDLLTEKAQT